MPPECTYEKRCAKSRMLLGPIAASLLCFVAAPAVATQNGDIAKDQAEIACTATMQDATALMKIAIDGTDAAIDGATKTFDSDAKRCPSPRYVNAGEGWSHFANAIVAHRAHVPWQATLDEAIAHFTQCNADFAKTKLGDRCQTSLGHATTYRTEWAVADGAAPSPAASP